MLIKVRHEDLLHIYFYNILLQLFLSSSSYRQAMKVKELMRFASDFGYFVCPRCRTTLERDFVAYCDRCGQCLDWSGYRKVKIIYLQNECKCKP